MARDPAVAPVLRAEASDAAWNEILSTLPSPHVLQSRQWGAFKHAYGWTAERWTWRIDDGAPVAAAQVLVRRWPARAAPVSLSLLYCPRGPTFDWSDRALSQTVLRDLAGLARRRGCISIKIEPDATASPAIAETLGQTGWRRSEHPVQFGSTMVLDLGGDDDELLARMKPKTRYNIGLAGRRGVTVRVGDEADLDRLYRLYAETSVRDGFVIRPAEYYRRAWGDFLRAGLARAFLAEVAGEAVAGLILFHFERRAWFLYGMSAGAHREKMPNHALQWAAIRWARQAGCHSYDLWGAPDEPDASDPLWGVFRFKQGFGARQVRLAGSWDHTARPVLSWLYGRALPRLLAWTRTRQQERTRRLLDPGV